MTMEIVKAVVFYLITICFNYQVSVNGVYNRPLPNDPFLTVWNAPTEKCAKKYGVVLNLTAFDIVVNPHQQFLGEFMTIFYDIGHFPQYLENGTAVNGGIPQLGNLTAHLAKCKEDIKKLIAERDFSGLSVIDQESWLPLWQFNFDSRDIYREKSRELVQKTHPSWNKTQVETEARREFETAARNFMDSTLQLAHQMTPMGHWGYYHYPYCFNHKRGQKHCSSQTRDGNDRLHWLFKSSTSLYPSAYLVENRADPASFVFGHLEEAFRISRQLTSNSSVYLYSTYRYTDTKKFYSKEDLINSIKLAADFGSSGVVLWGSNYDIHDVAGCVALQTYLDNTLGPFIRMINNYTEVCSENVCSNHGRCYRKDLVKLMEMTETFLSNADLKFVRFTEENYSNLYDYWYLEKYFSSVMQKVSTWNVQPVDYGCRCYKGWQGEHCEKQI